MIKYLLTLFVVVITFAGVSQSDEAIQHKLNVQIEPGTSFIAVTDSLSGIVNQEFIIHLNAALSPTFFSKNAKAEKIGGDTQVKDVGMDRDDADGSSSLKINKWKIKLNTWF